MERKIDFKENCDMEKENISIFPTGEKVERKSFNHEICVCALLATNSLCAKSSAEMG